MTVTRCACGHVKTSEEIFTEVLSDMRERTQGNSPPGEYFPLPWPTSHEPEPMSRNQPRRTPRRTRKARR